MLEFKRKLIVSWCSVLFNVLKFNRNISDYQFLCFAPAVSPDDQVMSGKSLLFFCCKVMVMFLSLPQN
jgi:hypothetical protein